MENGDIVIAYPVPMHPWVKTLMRRRGRVSVQVPMKRLQLDELGAMAWELMDGCRPVWEIIDRFSKTSRMYPKEAEVSVAVFLRELGRRGIIAFK